VDRLIEKTALREEWPLLHAVICHHGGLFG